MNAITKTEAAKPMLLDALAAKANLLPDEFAATVRKTCGMKQASAEEFAAFLLVAKEYNLNPLTKEIYAFPAKGGGIVPVVSIDGWVNLVNSHPACDGFEFDFEHDEDGKLVSCTCRMFRKDRGRPVVVTEYLSECSRNTDPWKMQHRMLRHKAMIQAARYAFGFSGIYDEDEGEKIAQSAIRDVTPPAPPPPPPSPSGGGKTKNGAAESRTDRTAPTNNGGNHVTESDGSGDPKASDSGEQAGGAAQDSSHTSGSTNTDQVEDAEVVETALPADLDAWLEDITSRMRQAKSMDLLNEIREHEIGPLYNDLPDEYFNEVEGVYHEMCEALAPSESEFPGDKPMPQTDAPEPPAPAQGSAPSADQYKSLETFTKRVTAYKSKQQIESEWEKLKAHHQKLHPSIEHKALVAYNAAIERVTKK